MAEARSPCLRLDCEQMQALPHAIQLLLRPWHPDIDDFLSKPVSDSHGRVDLPCESVVSEKHLGGSLLAARKQPRLNQKR